MTCGMLIGSTVRELDAIMHYVSLEKKYLYYITLENISFLSTTYCLEVVTLIKCCN